MSFEEEISRLSAHFFFQEFSYSKNTFRPTPADEVELADHIVWLDDVIVAFQLKERQVEGCTTPEREAQWFDRKVLSLATKQVRDTLTYLEAHDQIRVENHRGHQRDIEISSISTVHKVVCYLPNDALPPECGVIKFHRSRTVGNIHLIQGNDYLGIVRTLLTPAEFSDYLSFREELIEKWDVGVNHVPESALVGQYLSGNADRQPMADFVEYVRALEHRIDEWDMSGVIKSFPERITTNNEPTDYYPIVTEVAKLKRNELREFKERFQLSMEKCRSGEFVQPYRIVCPRTSCAFLFIPIERELVERRRQGLENMTYGCKYDLKVPKCIGISFAPDENGWYSLEWCYLEFPWTLDAEMEERLRESNPFRPVKTVELQRYHYDEGE